MLENFSAEFEEAKWFATASDGSISDVEDIFLDWRIKSNFTTSQLITYIHDFYHYWYIFRIWLITVGVLKCVCAILGFVGYLFETITMLKSPHFTAVSYVYHKAIIAVEFPVVLIVLQQGICNFVANEPLVLFTIDLVASYPVADSLGSTADLITVFMSVERALQLFSPEKFEKFNRRWVAWLCICVSFVISAVLNIPDCFAESATPTEAGRLWLAPTGFGRGDIYINFSHARDTMNLAKGAAVSILAIMVEIGLLRMRKNRAKATSAENFSRQLCILNLTCSIPVTIHAILYVVYWKYLNENKLGEEAVVLTYEEAQVDLTRALWCLLENLFLDISYLFSHCFHFYLYFALSTSFRSSVRKHLWGQNKIKEMTTA